MIALNKYVARGIAVLSVVLFSFAVSAMDKSPAAEGAKVYIVSPADGDTVSNPVTVVFGLSGMGVAQPIPADDNYKHFGKGQTETTIELAPGKHTLQLLLGNFLHIPHETAVASDVIEITVE